MLAEAASACDPSMLTSIEKASKDNMSGLCLGRLYDHPGSFGNMLPFQACAHGLDRSGGFRAFS